VLIAIEGIDGSGKGTQTTLLAERLSALGKKVKIFRFPQYEETFFGREVGCYLNGDYGSIEAVPAKFSALLYALDRFQALRSINSHLEEGAIVICDRYTPSNMAHQSARVDGKDSIEIQNWIETVEYKILGLPEPDAVIFLDVEVGESQRLVAQKPKRSYTDKSHDLHEDSAGHLGEALLNFRKIADRKGWCVINCASGDTNIRSISEISDEIVAFVCGLLNE
jgi:dTMP kinase